MKKNRTVFGDSDCVSVTVKSCWKTAKDKVPTKSIECQTTTDIYSFNEMEIQTGLFTELMQDQIKDKYKGVTLINYLLKKHKHITRDEHQWRQHIDSGFVFVDGETCIDPDLKLEKDFVLEFVDVRSDKGSQTDSFKFEETKETTIELKSSRMNNFINKVSPNLMSALEQNLKSKAFQKLDAVDSSDGSVAASGDATFWKVLSVDLERKKVLYPDWAKATHSKGVITKCVVTRSKERVYDVDFEDGGSLLGVREEYIRLLGGYLSDKKQSSSAGGAASALLPRLQEGVRVHLKVVAKSGLVKYFPGRIVKVTRSASAGLLFDVEVEGGRVEAGRLVEDLLIGLVEGQQVEAKRPQKVSLQCTGISWNATGNFIAASYGRNDILGWCDFPGAVCCWNVFGKNFSADSPDLVLDHASCLMAVAYHPVVPSLVAAGSFNGEVIVWDLSSQEAQARPFALSPVIEYAHKEPVVDLKWMFDPAVPADTTGGSWLLCSVGSDGKVLFWSLANKLQHPVKGTTLSKHRTSTKRRYPASHGASAVAFSNAVSSDGGAGRFSRPKWMLVGQEGGAVVRGQVHRILGGAPLSQESLRSLPAVDEVFPPLRKDIFAHQPHIGSVCALDCSPFSRNVFLSAGGDGRVNLSHLLEREPLRCWEPLHSTAALLSSSSATSSRSEVASPFISCVQFSPTRPTVFAAGSSDGLLFLYDMHASLEVPVKVLEAAPLVIPLNGGGAIGLDTAAPQKKPASSTRQKESASDGGSGRAGITDLAFNPKQRDLLAVCDWLGRVHLWKLSWGLANRHKDEMAVLSEMSNLGADGAEEEEK